MRGLEPGDALPNWEFTVPDAAGIRELAELLDDPSPIHLDAAAVAALGLGDRIMNQGPVNIGYVLNMLEEAAPGAEVRDLRLRLLAAVFAGDAVVVGGRVESASPDGPRRRLGCGVWLDVQGTGRALEGTATLLVPG